jgi:hypothetical protein
MNTSSRDRCLFATRQFFTRDVHTATSHAPFHITPSSTASRRSHQVGTYTTLRVPSNSFSDTSASIPTRLSLSSFLHLHTRGTIDLEHEHKSKEEDERTLYSPPAIIIREEGSELDCVTSACGDYHRRGTRRARVYHSHDLGLDHRQNAYPQSSK